MGTERKSMIISDEDKRNTAYHEAGHAWLSMFFPEPIRSQSDDHNARRALGLTQQLPLDDATTTRRTSLKR